MTDVVLNLLQLREGTVLKLLPCELEARGLVGERRCVTENAGRQGLTLLPLLGGLQLDDPRVLAELFRSGRLVVIFFLVFL